MSAKMGVTAQELNKNANKTKKEEQKLREKLQRLFKENKGTTQQQFKQANSNSNSSKINVQKKQNIELNSKEKIQKTKSIKTQKSPEIAKKSKFNKKQLQKQENQTQKQAKQRTESMKPNLKSDRKKTTIKRTATPKIVQPVKKRKQQDCQKLLSYDDSSSDNEYCLNPEEEARANIVDEYLENEMNYEDSLEEEMEEEEEEMEEEEQNYTDFDEDDYEEENDNYFYSDDDDSSYDDSESVYSYENDLETAADDLIIHKGTATKRPLEAKDGTVNFDSDHEGVQIVELEQSKVKVIKQCSEYDRDVLLKLSKVERDFTLKLNVSENEESDCPQLIPVMNDENVQYVTDDEMEIYEEEDESMSADSYADYEECDSDDWSYTSESITAKYDTTADLHKKCYMPVKMQAHVIQAVGSVACNNNESDPKKIVDEADLTASAIMERMIKTTQNKAVIITKPVHEYIQDVDDYEESSSNSQSPKNNLNNNASVLDTSNNNNLDQSLCENNLIDNRMECSQIELEQQQPNVQMPKATAMKTRIFMPLISTRFVLAVLKDPIYFYGTIRFKVLVGALQVYGFQPLLNTEYELFSPRGCSAVNLVPMPTQSTSQTDLDALRMQLHAEFDEDTWKNITKTYNAQNDAIVMLLRNDERARLIMHFRRYMNENVFPNIRTESSDKPLQAAEQLLNCYINKSSTHALQIPNDWQKLPLLTNMRLLLAGGKSVGKSTLLRYLVNRLLSTNELARQNGVLLVDLDIGQPELCAPETVSCTLLRRPLLGPGFFLNQPADCAYLVGQVNVTLCAQRYLRAVQMLIDHCKNNKDYENVPWIINTMGYNQGIGLEFIAAICELLQPTHVVQIQSNDNVNNFPELLEPSILRCMEQQLMGLSVADIDRPLEKYAVNDFSLHVIPAAVQQLSRYQREWSMSAKDMRFAILISQISDILIDQSIYMCERPPYCAALTDIKVRSLNEPHRKSFELQQALTANIVYLCRQDTATDEVKPIKCFGIAVVRSIDEKQIYITPAAAIENMQIVNCLVLSEQPLPTANLKQQAGRAEETYLPFLYATKANASTAVKHIYHRTAEFQTGKHRELLA